MYTTHSHHSSIHPVSLPLHDADETNNEPQFLIIVNVIILRRRYERAFDDDRKFSDRQNRVPHRSDEKKKSPQAKHSPHRSIEDPRFRNRYRWN